MLAAPCALAACRSCSVGLPLLLSLHVLALDVDFPSLVGFFLPRFGLPRFACFLPSILHQFPGRFRIILLYRSILASPACVISSSIRCLHSSVRPLAAAPLLPAAHPGHPGVTPYFLTSFLSMFGLLHSCSYFGFSLMYGTSTGTAGITTRDATSIPSRPGAGSLGTPCTFVPKGLQPISPALPLAFARCEP